MKFGNERLSLAQNIMTVVFFFFSGCSYLMFYNTILNVGDRLAEHFDYSLSYMSTFPLFYNWFNFLIAIILTYMASTMKKYPNHIMAHVSFILHILLFIIAPFVLNYVPNDGIGFWCMIVVSTFNGIPTPMNSSVFMGLSGMFSSVHSAIYFVGMAAGGLISSLLRIFSGAILSDEKSDIFFTFYLNGLLLVVTYIMYNVMYFTVPLLQEFYAGKSESGIDEESEKILNHESTAHTFFRVLKSMFINLFSIGFVFFVTLSIFPGFFTGTHYDESDIKQATTVQITTFIFMLGDLLSRFAVYIKIPYNKWIIFGFSVVRIIFYVPVFIYYYGVYTSPYVMFVIMLLFSFTNGYTSAWAIQIAYKNVAPADMKIAGNLVMVAMNVGLSIGGTLLFLMSSILPAPTSDSS